MDDATRILRDMYIAYQERFDAWPTARKQVDVM
jgi:hypothetical protein